MFEKLLTKMGLMKISNARLFVGNYNYTLSKLVENQAYRRFGEDGFFKDGTYNAHKKAAEETFDKFMDMGSKRDICMESNDNDEIVLSA